MIQAGVYTIGVTSAIALFLVLVSKLFWRLIDRFLDTNRIEEVGYTIWVLGCVAGITLVLTGLANNKMGADQLATGVGRFAAKALIGGICTLFMTALTALILAWFASRIIDHPWASSHWGPLYNRPGEMRDWVAITGGAAGILLVLAGLIAIPFCVNLGLGIGGIVAVIALAAVGVQWLHNSGWF